MAKILLDYVFPVSVITPTPEASTAFLKQVCVVANPKAGQEGNVGTTFLCTSMAQVAARTDNTNAQQLFNAGMSRVYVLLADDLDLVTPLVEELGEFYTILISDDFVDADIVEAAADGTVTVTSYANLVSGADDVVTVAGVAFTAQAGAATPGDPTFQAATSNDDTAASLAAQINAHEDVSEEVTATVVGAVVTITANETGWDGNDIGLSYTDNDANVGITLAGLSAGKLSGGAGIFVGEYDGVIGVHTTDSDVAAAQAVIEKRCVFLANSTNKAKNLFYAFGSLLSNPTNWLNQQYITMPVDDEIDELGEAEALFDDKISFVISDDEFGVRLALFCAGGRAIVAPYILKNLRVDLQSEALQWISGNQPQYTIKEAALLETRLQQDVINEYIADNWISAGVVEITLEEDNFVAEGSINVAEPKALWRVFSEMRQTL
jgi:hypothetical protein